MFKFDSPEELIQWYHNLQSVTSKEIKIKKYQKRVKKQHIKLANSTKIAQFQKIVNDLKEKLNELQKIQITRRTFENEN